MTERQDVREAIREIVAMLHRVDDQLAALAKSLSLPPDVAQMWESRIPMDEAAYLYATLEAVRNDCIQKAVEMLQHADHQSDVSLRREFMQAGQHPGPELQ